MIFKRIKWAYQRVVRGWDDTALWALDDHFTEVIIPPLKKFCLQEIQSDGIEQMEKLDPIRISVYQKTLEYIYLYENQTFEEEIEGKPLRRLASYFANHIGYYWD